MENNIIIFNPKFKERFLSRYNEQTKDTYGKILKSVSKSWEIPHNRDIYTANNSDVYDILGSLDNTSISSINTKKTVLSNYIDFSIEEGMEVPSGINYFRTVTKNELKEFVGKIKKTNFITRQDIYDTINVANNMQDLAILVLLFESVEGKGMSEILYLMKQDVDIENKTITIRNHKDRNEIIRVIKDIHPLSIKIIEDACNEQIYIRNIDERRIKKDGSTVFKSDATLEYSPFVLRKAIQRKDQNLLDSISKSTLLNRLNRVVKEYMGKPHMTPYDIWKSGLFEKIYLLAQEKEGKENLTGEDYINILQSFGRKSQNYCDIKTSFELIYPYLDKEYKSQK